MHHDSADARVRRILREQFDLELYLKQNEIGAINERLRHAEALLAVLASAISSQGTSSGDGHLASLRQRLQGDSNWQAQAQAQEQRVRPRRAAAAAAAAANSDYLQSRPLDGALYAVRSSDGASVCMVCPACRRRDFGSLQGFLNHCRLQHAIEFAGHDDAVRVCGQPLDAPAAQSPPPGKQPSTRRSAVSARLAAALSSAQLASV
ncbi:hypothetical protein LPJ66_012071, partial [Kickxella alabastrina]